MKKILLSSILLTAFIFAPKIDAMGITVAESRWGEINGKMYVVNVMTDGTYAGSYEQLSDKRPRIKSELKPKQAKKIYERLPSTKQQKS